MPSGIGVQMSEGALGRACALSLGQTLCVRPLESVSYLVVIKRVVFIAFYNCLLKGGRLGRSIDGETTLEKTRRGVGRQSTASMRAGLANCGVLMGWLSSIARVADFSTRPTEESVEALPELHDSTHRQMVV
jgi:hypothetical protein